MQLDAAIVTNEITLPSLPSPEANEGPRTIQCLQFKFGKHVIEPGGRIDGRDYHTTAAPQTPLAQVPAHTSLYPFGVGDLTDWEKMRFSPIVKVTRMIGDKPYVICGCVTARPEAGDGKGGRKYQEAHYIAVPAQEWSIALIPRLTTVLNTTPRVVGEPSTMPDIEESTNTLDEPLPQNWFNDAKDILVRLAGGQTLSQQNWDADGQQKFLQNLFLALVCLPEPAARQVSFGAGIGRDGVQDGKVGLRAFHGMSGFAYDRSLKITDQPWKNDNAERLKFGEDYVAALLPLIASAKTPREVMRAVTQLPKPLVAEVTKKMFG